MTSLPPLIMTSEKSSFARLTIEDRKPKVIDSILTNFDSPPSIRKNLINLRKELTTGVVQPLHENTSDRTYWENALQPFLRNTWLELPWFLAETFFFRRVLEATQYFQPGPSYLIDPYKFLKSKELSRGMSVLSANYPTKEIRPLRKGFQFACYQAMWGNRGDLSNLDLFVTDMGIQPERIILDQSEIAFTFLASNPGNITYIIDNVGIELLFDLVFIDFLLESGLANSVTCFVKNQPFYVSDAMKKDVLELIDMMKSSPENEICCLGNRLKSYWSTGLFSLEDPPFFTTNLMYNEMPEVLKDKVASSIMTILKGDVNYRRLFGDRHWPPTTQVVDVASYFPSSFLSLRTLKGELVLGLSEEMIDKIKQEADSNWMINGKRGMITFLENSN